MNKVCQILLLICLFSPLKSLRAQTPQVIPDGQMTVHPDSNLKVYISKILVKGNRRTKTYIIERELPFKTGDSIFINRLVELMEKGRELVYNTRLFNQVSVYLRMTSAFDVEMDVEVRERWYIYPQPQFQLVDRNWNVWRKEFNYSLNRVNYGVKFLHTNLSGRGDQLRLTAMTGYNRSLFFSYTAPYSNRSLTEGFNVTLGYSQAREMSYGTGKDNRVLFYPPENIVRNNSPFVRDFFTAGATYTSRKGYFARNLYTLQYQHYSISDSILARNPKFNNLGKNSFSLIDFTYQYSNINVDNVGYPLKGRIYNIVATKRGLGFSGGTDMLSLEARYSKFYKLKKKWYFDFASSMQIKLPFDQPYLNQSLLGYQNNVLRGLEVYVVDGVAGGLLRNTLRRKLVEFSIPFPFRSRSHSVIPFTIFAKTYTDLGYSYNRKDFETRLNNRLLYSGGFGIDVLSLYDINLRIEYSFNQLGENGLFLRNQFGL